jgi:hypothetical protein
MRQPKRPPPRDAQQHWQWVRAALANSTGSSFLVVGGHYPIHSPSAHGGDECLRHRLEPLLRRARTSVYLSGHDHALFHIGGAAAHAVQYHGVGAGFHSSPSRKHAHTVPRGHLRFHRRGRRRNLYGLEGGFVGVSVSAAGLTVTHIGANGKQLHRHTALPRYSSSSQTTATGRGGLAMGGLASSTKAEATVGSSGTSDKTCDDAPRL